MKKVYKALSVKGLLLCVLIMGLLPVDAISSDPRKIAEKYGLDLKKLTPLTFRIGTLAPAGTPWITFALDNIVLKAREETDGFIRFQILGGGNMGDDLEVLKKMKSGQLQGCACTALGVNAAVPETSIFSLPFLFRNYDEIDYIFKKFRKDLNAMFLKRGYRLFGLTDAGFLYLFTRDKVSSIEDIKRQKLVTWWGGIEKATLDELNTRYTPIAVPEIASAFKTGLIDAGIAPPAWMLVTEVFLYTHYFIDTPFFYSPVAIFMDEKQIREMEKSYPPGFGREMINYMIDVIVQGEKDWKMSIREYEKKCISAYINSGGMSVSFSQSDMDILRRAAQNVRKKLAGKAYSQEFLSRVESELSKYRKEKSL